MDGQPRWCVHWLAHPQLPLLVVCDADDSLVYVGFSLETRERFEDLQAFAQRHGAILETERPPEEAERLPAVQQLREYLDGRRREFDLPLRLWGTDFQKSAWAALQTIPYGQVRSYGQQAAHIGSPGAARAVGHANGQNPISIIVPCHRVVGADGQLTGFGGGIEAKRWLLELERRGVTPQWSPRPGPRRPPEDVSRDQLGLFAE